MIDGLLFLLVPASAQAQQIVLDNENSIFVKEGRIAIPAVSKSVMSQYLIVFGQSTQGIDILTNDSCYPVYVIWFMPWGLVRRKSF